MWCEKKVYINYASIIIIHINRLTWLKVRLKYLHLKRRCPDSNPAVVKTLIRRIYATSERLKGYRAVWKHLRDKYHCIVRQGWGQVLFFVLNYKVILSIIVLSTSINTFVVKQLYLS